MSMKTSPILLEIGMFANIGVKKKEKKLMFMNLNLVL